mgnify:CR=1 FL=1
MLFRSPTTVAEPGGTVTYTVTVENVRDKAGNLIDPTANTATFSFTVDGFYDWFSLLERTRYRLGRGRPGEALEPRRPQARQRRRDVRVSLPRIAPVACAAPQVDRHDARGTTCGVFACAPSRSTTHRQSAQRSTRNSTDAQAPLSASAVSRCAPGRSKVCWNALPPRV